MMKRFLAGPVLAAFLATGALAEGMVHKLAIHVDQNDPAVMNIALNNAQNAANYYESQGDELIIEIVAHGPGLNMFIPGKSPVEQRISTMSLEMDNISFAACGNTIRGMSKKAGHEIKVMDEAKVVTSGVVRLIELQEDGYSYVRP